MRRFAAFCVVLGVVLAVNSAWADDYNPPPWAGEERVTRQVWEFDEDINPAAPDIDENPMGVASLHLTDGLWKPTDMGESGVYKFEDQTIITIPNYIEPLPLKLIWLELTYTASGAPDVYADDPTGARFWGVSQGSEQTGNYLHETWLIEMYPNPEEETIVILPRDCTTYLDEVVVWTICTVPEPATICLLGLGALALMRKRKA